MTSTPIRRLSRNAREGVFVSGPHLGARPHPGVAAAPADRCRP
jgi:hypothetical protein